MQTNAGMTLTANPQISQFQFAEQNTLRQNGNSNTLQQSGIGQIGVTNSLHTGLSGSKPYKIGGPFSQQDLGLQNKSFEIPSMEVNGRGPSYRDEQIFGSMGGGDNHHRSPISEPHTQIPMREHALQNFFGQYNAHDTYSQDSRVYRQDTRGRGRGNFRGRPRGGPTYKKVRGGSRTQTCTNF